MGIGPMKRDRVSSGSPFEKEVGFSRAVRVGSWVLVSGTAPIGLDGKTVGVNDPAAQARRSFEIAVAALSELGASVRDVVRTRVYLTQVEDWEAVAKVHGEFFGETRPASTMVQVKGLLDPDWRVEIEIDARIESP